ncbi:MAG: ACP S-malonyltransferase [Verrucomicrobia bacterium]|nr:ACP S-malonyltransferase [Verrucomicrobiota bacterium]
MGRDFYDAFPVAREIFQQADEHLKRHLSALIFQGPTEELTRTCNSQLAIYVTSMALYAVLEQQFPRLKPLVCAGHSLGEYSAITASKRLTFAQCLPLVEARSLYMNEACESVRGTMAAVLGLPQEEVEKLQGPNLWIANYNCPGQTVISGTQKGVEEGIEKVKKLGKRAIPLQVHGAFHSPLMQQAEERLKEDLKTAPLIESAISLVMNVPGGFVTKSEEVRAYLGDQVSRSVRWEQGIRAIDQRGVPFYLEIGCGKTLAGLNKRIGVTAPTLNLEKVEDLDILSAQLEKDYVPQ